MMKTLILNGVFTFVSCLHADVSAADLTESKPTGRTAASAKSAECPKGWNKMGVYSKIEFDKAGKVSETVRMKGGNENKLPSFKPTGQYKTKVGDPFCVDMTPDND